MKEIAALFVFFILCPILAPVIGWWTLIPLAVSGMWLIKHGDAVRNGAKV